MPAVLIHKGAAGIFCLYRQVRIFQCTVRADNPVRNAFGIYSHVLKMQP